MKMYFTRFCCFSRMVPYIRILLLVRSERFTSNFRQLKRRVISTPLIMLRSLSLKKDKSKNSTYILVNRVRRCSVRRSLSSLFNLLALFGARIGRAPLIVFAMIDDSHARAHDFLFLSLSLVLSRTRAQITNGVYLQEPDWTGNIELADRVNHDHYRTTVAKDAAKALRIKLLSRQPREQFLALTALECLMKNCGPDFHEMMLSKGLLETCMELGSNTTTNPIVRDKVLHLIREWSEHLNIREFKGVYRDLMRYGVKFPGRDDFLHPGGKATTASNSSSASKVSGGFQHTGGYDDDSNVDVTGDGMNRMNGGEPLHYPARTPQPQSSPALGIPRHSQSVPAKQVLKYDATMSDEDRRAIEMALREEEEGAQRKELASDWHWSSKRYQRSSGKQNEYKLDAIGRKPEGLMPVEGKFVNRKISLTKAQEHPDRVFAREKRKKKTKDAIESAQSILGVFEETLNASDKDDDLCGILAEQAKESSSSLVALLTEADGQMDEEMTSKLIELSEKLNGAIQKYERNDRENVPQTAKTTNEQQLQHDLLGLSSDERGFRETTISSPNPFMTSAPSNVPSGSAAKSDKAFDEIFGNSFSPQSPPQQPHEPMSLREKFMQEQREHQSTTQGSPLRSEMPSQILTPASQLQRSSPPASQALNGTATPLGFEAKCQKELQEVTLHDPFASLAINAGLTPKKGPENPAPKSASLSPPMSSLGERVVNSEMGTPPQRPRPTLQRSPTNPFDNDFKYPKI